MTTVFIAKLLTGTCIGIHPGRVEPASLIALTTFPRLDALQVRRSIASSLDTFIQCVAEDSWSGERFQV